MTFTPGRLVSGDVGDQAGDANWYHATAPAVPDITAVVDRIIWPPLRDQVNPIRNQAIDQIHDQERSIRTPAL